MIALASSRRLDGLAVGEGLPTSGHDLVACVKVVYQNLVNSSDFDFGVLALNFQLLLRAATEGGAHVVRAATQL
jgi:hypothetical protein